MILQKSSDSVLKKQFLLLSVAENSCAASYIFVKTVKVKKIKKNVFFKSSVTLALFSVVIVSMT